MGTPTLAAEILRWNTSKSFAFPIGFPQPPDLNHRPYRLGPVCGCVMNILELKVRQGLKELGFNVTCGISAGIATANACPFPHRPMNLPAS